MSPCLPSIDQYSLNPVTSIREEGSSKRENNVQEDVETRVNINYDSSGFKINKVTKQETFPSDEGQPAVKKSRLRVEITPIIGGSDRDMFHTPIAESVKFRPRKHSQSYDETNTIFTPYEASTYLPKERKSPGRQGSPYVKKQNPGSNLKSNGKNEILYFVYTLFHFSFREAFFLAKTLEKRDHKRFHKPSSYLLHTLIQ